MHYILCVRLDGQTPCLEGWIGNAGRCYLPVSQQMTYSDAGKYCSQFDSHLALNRNGVLNIFLIYIQYDITMS